AKRRRLDEQIAEKRDALEAKEAELDDADRDVDETREEKAELEDTLDELRRTRSKLEDVRYDIDTHEESVDALHDERAELEADYDELPDAPAGERSELDAEIERLRERESSLESELSELQSIVQFNEDMLDGDDVGRLDSLNEGSPGG